jgi:hypothetical protein
VPENRGLGDPDFACDVIRRKAIWPDLIGQTQKRLNDISLAILGGFAVKHGNLLSVITY